MKRLIAILSVVLAGCAPFSPQAKKFVTTAEKSQIEALRAENAELKERLNATTIELRKYNDLVQSISESDAYKADNLVIWANNVIDTELSDHESGTYDVCSNAAGDRPNIAEEDGYSRALVNACAIVLVGSVE